MHLIARDRSSPERVTTNFCGCRSLFLAWAGLGKMPIAFGMLQRPTASIFASVQFCTANSSDLVIRWFATCLKTGRLCSPPLLQSGQCEEIATTPKAGFSLGGVVALSTLAAAPPLYFGTVPTRIISYLIAWAHPIQSNAKHSLLGLRRPTSIVV